MYTISVHEGLASRKEWKVHADVGDNVSVVGDHQQERDAGKLRGEDADKGRALAKEHEICRKERAYQSVTARGTHGEWLMRCALRSVVGFVGPLHFQTEALRQDWGAIRVGGRVHILARERDQSVRIPLRRHR